MFEEFFGFTTKPFGKTPDPGFLYESPQHGEALARLEYAVEEKELSLLVGEIGSGKTTLSRALIDRIGEARPVILLINPRLTPVQLLRSIASGLGQRPARFRNDLLDQIHARLFELYEEGREPVLIIDEAQLIPTKATLEETERYIEHRIRVAVGSRSPFPGEAVRAMYHVTGVIPRRLNTRPTTAL